MAVTDNNRRNRSAPSTRPKRPSGGEAEPESRRERNKRDKLARIVAASQALFSTRGFAGTTTQEIAERAGIGTGTLFLYAKSKEDLLILVFRDEMIETSRAAFQAVPRRLPLVDQLMHVFEAMIAYHARDLALARVVLKEVTILTTPARRSDIRMLMRVVLGGIGDLIEEARRKGAIRQDADPALAAENLFATYFFSLLGWLSGQTPEAAMVERLRAKLQLAVDGLGT